MTHADYFAETGKPYRWSDDQQRYVSSWHPPDQEPEGTIHGSAAVCAAPGGYVIGSAGGNHGWELPGGRPEPGEDWRATLEREVMEEACARIDVASLMAFVRTECLAGPQTGIVLVRSLWVAHVTLLPWRPLHEIRFRKVVPPAEVLNIIKFPPGQLPIYQRWFSEAAMMGMRGG